MGFLDGNFDDILHHLDLYAVASDGIAVSRFQRACPRSGQLERFADRRNLFKVRLDIGATFSVFPDQDRKP